MSAQFDDVACTVCGCVCDDLKITVQDGRIVAAHGACPLSEPWLLAQRAQAGEAAFIEGRAVPLPSAVERAAQILREARLPLIYGLSRSSTEGQRAACRLADRLGAVIDTTASLCHAPSILALQQVGESTCSLGEVRHRCDLVIYWGSNPVVSHPRHLERYSVDAPGMFVGNRQSRTLVVVDVRRTETAERADLFIQVPPGSDFDLLWALRTLVNGHSMPADWSMPGVNRETIVDLAQRMMGCRSGAAFFGLGLTQRGVGHANVRALLELVSDLNRVTRFYARRMRIYGDVAGADSVLCWQTGFPFSVSLSRGYPRYNPGEYSAADLLRRREVDACVLVGAESWPVLPAEAQAHLQAIPTILLDNTSLPLPWQPTVSFTTPAYGVHRAGTAYRMDEVPIPLRAVLPSTLPSDGEILRLILERL